MLLVEDIPRQSVDRWNVGIKYSPLKRVLPVRYSRTQWSFEPDEKLSLQRPAEIAGNSYSLKLIVWSRTFRQGRSLLLKRQRSFRNEESELDTEVRQQSY